MTNQKAFDEANDTIGPHGDESSAELRDAKELRGLKQKRYKSTTLQTGIQVEGDHSGAWRGDHCPSGAPFAYMQGGPRKNPVRVPGRPANIWVLRLFGL